MTDIPGWQVLVICGFLQFIFGIGLIVSGFVIKGMLK